MKIFFLCIISLPLSGMAGQFRGQISNFISPGGVTEQCIALASTPGEISRPEDRNQEQKYCRIVSKSVTVYLSGHQHGFYPFVHNGQHYIGQAALGSWPRRSFTLIDIATDGTLNVTPYTGADFKEAVQRSTLPPQISYNGIIIIRDDVASLQR